MRTIPLAFPLFLAILALLFGTALFPNLHLFAFSPFFAIVYNKRSLIASLWITALCGTFLDLISSELTFGLTPLYLVLTTCALYRAKKHFFEDKPLSLSLFTALISSVATLLHIATTTIFDRAIHTLSWKFALIDLIIMPMIDAIYAFIWFYLPMRGYLHIRKVGFKTLWLRFKSHCQLPDSE
ncbi:MAG: hypothetical protein HYZ48_03200 [Chlamydiales bacterium]|nr:hypothetical protein [Chlamydiales bacterium]